MNEKEAIQQGLRIIRGKYKYAIEFEGLTNAEAICYVMCKMCGWSARRLAKYLGVSHQTVSRNTRKAVKKRDKK